MTNKQQEYLDYLNRVSYNKNQSIQDVHNEKLTRLVGESYGLSCGEMNEVVE